MSSEDERITEQRGQIAGLTSRFDPVSDVACISLAHRTCTDSDPFTLAQSILHYLAAHHEIMSSSIATAAVPDTDRSGQIRTDRGPRVLACDARLAAPGKADIDK
jgi:hypothetical protein